MPRYKHCPYEFSRGPKAGTKCDAVIRKDGATTCYKHSDAVMKKQREKQAARREHKKLLDRDTDIPEEELDGRFTQLSLFDDFS